MKRLGRLKLMITAVLSVIAFGTSAQLEQGTVVVDGYYGFPNFGKTLSLWSQNALKPILEREIPNITDEVEIGIKGWGPMGGRLEYMVRPRIGLGADFIINNTTANFAVDSLYEDGTLFDQFDVQYSMTRIRIHFRFNFHYMNRKHIDMYSGVGVGYNNRLHRIRTDVLNFRDLSSSFSFAYPYSARLTLWGMRVYPHPNVGINMEVGLGGPLVSAGVSARFNTMKKSSRNSSTFE